VRSTCTRGPKALRILWCGTTQEGKTREAAEQVFAEVVKKITQAMPGDWVGQETPKSDLGARELREFKASTKSNGDQTIGGPSIRANATRLGELYRVTVQLNAHHVD
jgi:hypothetical protein